LVYPYSFQLNIFDQNNLLWSSVLFNISGGESSK
jgi:hypothetical protein